MAERSILMLSLSKDAQLLIRVCIYLISCSSAAR
jgi:hypothetical protein